MEYYIIPQKRIMSFHHLVPKKRGGSKSEENLLRLWRDKHNAWHFLFGDLTIDEIISCLERIRRMKGG